jgi:plastocyanin
MRRVFAVLLAIGALAPVAGTAGPLACQSPCVVQVSGFAYVPESPVVTSGSLIRFTTAEETSHPTMDDDSPDVRCMFAQVGYGEEDALVRLQIVGDMLYATVAPGTEFEETLPCSSAVAVPTGSFVFGFHCRIHPWMRSGLVVEPA